MCILLVRLKNKVATGPKCNFCGTSMRDENGTGVFLLSYSCSTTAKRWIHNTRTRKRLRRKRNCIHSDDFNQGIYCTCWVPLTYVYVRKPRGRARASCCAQLLCIAVMRRLSCLVTVASIDSCPRLAYKDNFLRATRHSPPPAPEQWGHRGSQKLVLYCLALELLACLWTSRQGGAHLIIHVHTNSTMTSHI